MTYREDDRIEIFFLVILVVIAIISSGCSTKETARSAMQGDLAIQGAQHLLASPEIDAAVQQLPPELHAAITDGLRDINQLLNSARISIAPAIKLTSQGEFIDAQLTVDDAIRNTSEFTSRAARQAGRAEAETDRLLSWLAVGKMTIYYGQSLVGNGMSTWLFGGGFMTLLMAGLGKGVQMYNQQRMKVDLFQKEKEDVIRYASEVEYETDPEKIERIKRDHIKRQRERGTLSGIAESLNKVKS